MIHMIGSHEQGAMRLSSALSRSLETLEVVVITQQLHSNNSLEAIKPSLIYGTLCIVVVFTNISNKQQ